MTIQEIRAQILADIESETGTSTPLFERSVYRIIAVALSGVVNLLYRYLDWVKRQIFVRTMDSESLALRAEEFGMSRSPGKKWVGEIEITGTSGTLVPSGTLFQFSGDVYQTTQDVILPAGPVASPVESLDIGEKVQRDVNDVLSMVSPISDVERDALIVLTSQNAEDPESDESFRERILARQQRPPQGGSAADFVAWAREVPGVVKAFAYRTAIGEVTVYPLTGFESSDRIPNTLKLTEVQAYVGSNVRAPLACTVLAAAPTVTIFDVSVSSLVPDTPLIRSKLEDAFRDYFLSRFPAQYADEVNPTNIVSLAELYKVAFDVGASQILITFSESGVGTDLSGYTLDDCELGEMGVLSWA